MSEAEQPFWPLSNRVEVARLPARGSEITLQATESERAAIARALGILGVRSLSGQIALTPRGKRVVAKGRIKAEVTQACVVTLDPVEQSVDEEIDLTFASPEEAAAAERRAFGDPDAEGERELLVDPKTLLDPETLPEPIEGGVIDVWAVALESLSLGLDPYPRKAGAEFAPPAEPAGEGSPFAALKKLKGE